MKKIKKKARTIPLKGTHYEIGKELGRYGNEFFKKEEFIIKDKNWSKEKAKEKVKHLEKYMSEILEEIEGFAFEVGIDLYKSKHLYTLYNLPFSSCSQIAYNHKKSDNGHTILGSNYDLSHSIEDFIVFKTEVLDKYAYIGTSQSLFGRDDGMNEKGLGISLSACGLSGPALHISRYKRVEGFYYPSIFRMILENAKNVKEGLDILSKYPMASNINIVLADKEGSLGFYNHFFGEIETKYINGLSKENKESIMIATNHINKEKMKKFGQAPARNSIRREEMIEEFLKDDNISILDLKNLMIEEYPKGLSFRFYKNELGTLKTVIRDLNLLQYEIAWGGDRRNGFDIYTFDDEMVYKEKDVLLENKDIRKYLKELRR